MRDEGMSIEEIGQRVRHSPEHVERIIAWTELPRSRPPTGAATRAIHNRVLTMRADGESHQDIGNRFGRSARYIRQVEGLAHYRKGLELLG